MNVLYFVSKKRMNGKGLAPIYCRITIRGQRSEFSTGISIFPNQWKKNHISDDHPEGSIHNT